MTYGKAFKPAIFLTVILLAILSLSACNDQYSAKVSTPSAPSAPETGTEAEGTGEPAAPAVSDRGIEVSQAKMDEIASGLKVVGECSLRAGWAVKSNDFDNLYFIAADMEGPGFIGPNDIAVWAVDSLEPGGSISSVNAQAKGLSSWPAAEGDISIKSEGVNEAKKCVEAVLPK